ncbi:hypothetical protein [Frischella perrara]|uniref:hypothetical protein n=1 Tax=Frischella perrara TaxID=1267021 RepID=UPI0023F48ED7|nr:hypothetical protein [Frischella perrara]
MTAELQLDFRENFYYSTKKPVTVKEIIESLQGLEFVVKQTRGTLQKLTDCKIDNVQLYINELKSGSLIEDVIVRVFFGSEEEKNKFCEKIHEKIGDGKMRNTIITAVLVGIIGYGIYLAIKPSDPNYVINANNNVIINIGDSQKITNEKLTEIIRDSITNQKSLAQNTIKVLSPARTDESSSIQIGDMATIPASTIMKTPTELNLQPLTDVVDYNDVPVIIRAMDLDKSNKGWGGIIVDKVDQRTKITFDPNIDINILAGRSSFMADVTVIKTLTNKDNEYKPTEIFIRSIKN